MMRFFKERISWCVDVDLAVGYYEGYIRCRDSCHRVESQSKYFEQCPQLPQCRCVHSAGSLPTAVRSPLLNVRCGVKQVLM
jgi:hypothetical protein